MNEVHQMIKKVLEEATELCKEEKETTNLNRIIKRLKADIHQHTLREEKDAVPLMESYLDQPNDQTKSKLIQMIEKLLTEHQLFDELINQLESTVQERDCSIQIQDKVTQLKEMIATHDDQAKNLYKEIILE